jgi:hypothetical protein
MAAFLLDHGAVCGSVVVIDEMGTVDAIFVHRLFRHLPQGDTRTAVAHSDAVRRLGAGIALVAPAQDVRGRQ